MARRSPSIVARQVAGSARRLSVDDQLDVITGIVTGIVEAGGKTREFPEALRWVAADLQMLVDRAKEAEFEPLLILLAAILALSTTTRHALTVLTAETKS